ncbi:protein psbn, partial [Phtheirospermum japonicum]
VAIFISGLLVSFTGYALYTAFGQPSQQLRDPFEEHGDYPIFKLVYSTAANAAYNMGSGEAEEIYRLAVYKVQRHDLKYLEIQSRYGNHVMRGILICTNGTSNLERA